METDVVDPPPNKNILNKNSITTNIRKVFLITLSSLNDILTSLFKQHVSQVTRAWLLRSLLLYFGPTRCCVKSIRNYVDTCYVCVNPLYVLSALGLTIRHNPRRYSRILNNKYLMGLLLYINLTRCFTLALVIVALLCASDIV